MPPPQHCRDLPFPCWSIWNRAGKRPDPALTGKNKGRRKRPISDVRSQRFAIAFINPGMMQGTGDTSRTKALTSHFTRARRAEH